MLRRPTVLLAALTATLVLTACGGDEPAAAPEASRTAPNGDVFNDADIAFATEMIPQHARALQMVDLTIGRSLDPEIERLAEDIRATQGPQIEMMVDWLMSWGEPIPETPRDHANADGSGTDEMAGLENASGAEFERLWLEMMVENHTTEIEMAEREQEAGAYPPAVELAGTVARTQRAEIDTMEDLPG